MRYAEKSFEIRFCAALSAAIMPFNRNPKWFGLTQAQERRKGIDAALGLGGSLLLFQFKAQSKSRIKIEVDQLSKLTPVEAQYPDSTYYVFPEAEDIYAAAQAKCMFNEAWCCTPSALNEKVKSTAKSASFALDAASSTLSQANPKKNVPIERTCKKLGCFCPGSVHQVFDDLRRSPRSLIRFIVGSWDGSDLADSSFSAKGIGIPIGRDLPSLRRDGGADRDKPTITSTEMFEELLGDRADQDLERGLQGMFIAQ